MTAVMKRFLYVVLGLLAGAATWGVEELVLRMTGGYLFQAVVQGLVLGIVFGYAFGAAEGIAITEPRKAAFTGLLGAGIGAAAGGLSTVGVSAAMIGIANSFGVDHAATTGVLLPISRIAAWGIVGAAIGSVEGLRTLSPRRTIAGLLGGLVGGLLGGGGLEWLIRIIPDQSVGRVVGFLILGAGVGFFLGEFERRFSFARLKVLTGPLKNKEYILSRRRTTIGSGVVAQVFLTAYPGTESRHAEIVERAGEMRITTSCDDVRVNEKPVSAARFLKYQDVIDLGGARLLLLPV